MPVNKIILFISLSILFYGCKDKIDIKKKNELIGLSEQLFHKKNIDFSTTLDLIKKNTTLKTTDSINFTDIYSNKSANIFYKVYEEPKGIIKFMSFHINNKKNYEAEYYDNGLIMCKINTSREGIRNGVFECYHENGMLRIFGEYLNNEKIGKEIGYDTLGNISYEFDY